MDKARGGNHALASMAARTGATPPTSANDYSVFEPANLAKYDVSRS